MPILNLNASSPLNVLNSEYFISLTQTGPSANVAADPISIIDAATWQPSLVADEKTFIKSDAPSSAKNQRAREIIVLVEKGYIDYEDPRVGAYLDWGVENNLFTQAQVEYAKLKWCLAVVHYMKNGLVHPDTAYATRAIAGALAAKEITPAQAILTKQWYFLNALRLVVAKSLLSRLERFYQPDAERALQQAVERGGMPLNIALAKREVYYSLRGYAVLIAVSGAKFDPKDPKIASILKTALDVGVINKEDLGEALTSYAAETSVWATIKNGWRRFTGFFVRFFGGEVKQPELNFTQTRLLKKLVALAWEFESPPRFKEKEPEGLMPARRPHAFFGAG